MQRKPGMLHKEAVQRIGVEPEPPPQRVVGQRLGRVRANVGKHLVDARLHVWILLPRHANQQFVHPRRQQRTHPPARSFVFREHFLQDSPDCVRLVQLNRLAHRQFGNFRRGVQPLGRIKLDAGGRNGKRIVRMFISQVEIHCQNAERCPVSFRNCAIFHSGRPNQQVANRQRVVAARKADAPAAVLDVKQPAVVWDEGRRIHPGVEVEFADVANVRLQRIECNHVYFLLFSIEFSMDSALIL